MLISNESSTALYSNKVCLSGPAGDDIHTFGGNPIACTVQVDVSNPSGIVAFFLRLRVVILVAYASGLAEQGAGPSDNLMEDSFAMLSSKGPVSGRLAEPDSEGMVGPVTYEDNYFTLLPGEARRVQLEFSRTTGEIFTEGMRFAVSSSTL